MISEIGVIVASIGLIFTGLSFYKFGKIEELRGFEAIYGDIARGLKEQRLLEAESPKRIEEQEQERQRKVDVLTSEFLADVSWLCYLIRHGQVNDETLVGSLKDQIINWYDGFAERRPEDVVNMDVFPDFQILATRFIYDKELGVQKDWYSKIKYAISHKYYY